MTNEEDNFDSFMPPVRFFRRIHGGFDTFFRVLGVFPANEAGDGGGT
jgi:hypothetical protein